MTTHIAQRTGPCWKTPSCRTAPVARVRLHHFWSQEGGGAIAALQVLIAADDDLGAAEITEGHIAACRHEHILWFQIAMHHLVVVQVVKCLQLTPSLRLLDTTQA